MQHCVFRRTVGSAAHRCTASARCFCPQAFSEEETFRLALIVQLAANTIANCQSVIARMEDAKGRDRAFERLSGVAELTCKVAQATSLTALWRCLSTHGALSLQCDAVRLWLAANAPSTVSPPPPCLPALPTCRRTRGEGHAMRPLSKAPRPRTRAFQHRHQPLRCARPNARRRRRVARGCSAVRMRLARGCPAARMRLARGCPAARMRLSRGFRICISCRSSTRSSCRRASSARV